MSATKPIPLAALRGGTAKAQTIGAVAQENEDARQFVTDIDNLV